jgi:hypothetical protein
MGCLHDVCTEGHAFTHHSPFAFFHRAAAAYLANAERCSGLRYFRLFLPPFRPSAIAAGFFRFAIASIVRTALRNST